MKTKTEPTNEQIAEALGWIRHTFGDDLANDWHWVLPGGKCVIYLPDFRNDLNACFKYVWPGIMLANPVTHGLRHILFKAFQTDNPAIALCQAFMEMKGGE